jgi:hypothetical protein
VNFTTPSTVWQAQPKKEERGFFFFALIQFCEIKRLTAKKSKILFLLFCIFLRPNFVPREKHATKKKSYNSELKTLEGSPPGLPDFSLSKIPNRGKIYQITTKYTKWP